MVWVQGGSGTLCKVIQRDGRGREMGNTVRIYRLDGEPCPDGWHSPSQLYYCRE